MTLATRLNAIHASLLAGSRTASLDLFEEALGPLQGFLRRNLSRLTEEQAYDLATDAILLVVSNPGCCDTGRSSLWSFLCRVARGDGIDLLRRRSREAAVLGGVIDDVEFWTSRAKEVFRGEDAIDARRIMTVRGGRLARTEDEANVLTLILQEEKRTDAFALALGLEPGGPETERSVKKAKDSMLLRLKRLRDEL